VASDLGVPTLVVTCDSESARNFRGRPIRPDLFLDGSGLRPFEAKPIQKVVRDWTTVSVAGAAELFQRAFTQASVLPSMLVLEVALHPRVQAVDVVRVLGSGLGLSLASARHGGYERLREEEAAGTYDGEPGLFTHLTL